MLLANDERFIGTCLGLAPQVRCTFWAAGKDRSLTPNGAVFLMTGRLLRSYSSTTFHPTRPEGCDSSALLGEEHLQIYGTPRSGRWRCVWHCCRRLYRQPMVSSADVSKPNNRRSVTNIQFQRLRRWLWPLYWFAQGTMFWALFVVGHDW